MIRILHKTNIDFVKLRHIFFGISGVVVLIGIISLSIKGVNLGLDFTGGTMIQLKFDKPLEIGTLRTALEAGKVDAGIQSYAAENSYAIKVKGTQDNVNDTANKILAAVKTIPGASFTEEKRDYVGPVVGNDLAKKAMFSIILSMFGIIIYVAFRFSNPVWGTAGVIGLLHDVFVALTAMSITNREIDLVIVAASAPGIVQQALACSRPGSRILLFAQTSATERIEASGTDICVGERTLFGCYSASIDLQKESARLVFSGDIPVEELISHRLPLVKIRSGIDLALHPGPNSLKIIVQPQRWS